MFSVILGKERINIKEKGKIKGEAEHCIIYYIFYSNRKIKFVSEDKAKEQRAYK